MRVSRHRSHVGRQAPATFRLGRVKTVRRAASASARLLNSQPTHANEEQKRRVTESGSFPSLSAPLWWLPGTVAVRRPPPRPAAAAACRPPTSAECVEEFAVACYSPRQLQRQYDLAPLYASGFDAKRCTIGIIDPYGSPTLARDLATFDHALGLPAPPSLRVLQPVGKCPPSPRPIPRWQRPAKRPATSRRRTKHPRHPQAKLFTGGGFPQFIAAENDVVTHNFGDVISRSFGLPEQNAKRSVLLSLRYPFVRAEHDHVAVLAASNDLGVTGPRRPERSMTIRSSTGRRLIRS